MRKNYRQILINGLACALVAACQGSAPTPTVAIVRMDIVSSGILSGRIEASQRAVITAPYEGNVDELHVGVGTRVQKDQPVVVMNTRALEERLRAEHARLSQLEGRLKNLYLVQAQNIRDSKRLGQLLKSRSIAAIEVERKQGEVSANANDIDATLSDVELAKANVASTEKQIGSSTLRTPIDGLVTSSWVPADSFVAGSAVRLGEHLVTVSGDGSWTMKTFVKEQDVMRVNPGMKAEIVLPSIPDKSWVGKVLSVDDAATVDPTTGVAVFRVALRFEIKDMPVKSGMESLAILVFGMSSKALAIPRAAVRQKSGKFYALVKRGAGFEPVQFKPGLIGDTHIEVLEGLPESTEVAAVYDPIRN